MKFDFYHEIDHDPEPEDVGTIRITARIFGEHDNLIFTTSSLAEKFIDDENDECHSKEKLNYFLMEALINDDVIVDAMLGLIVYVNDVTCSSSNEYSPGCALEVWLDILPDDLDDDDTQIEEAIQVSFYETNNIQFRPTSKLVVKSLTRKIYKKIIKKKKKEKKIDEKIISSGDEKCTICLEEFKNGGRLVTLPCGHDFDDECIVKWLETSHICPLCRFELPCEDQ